MDTLGPNNWLPTQCISSVDYKYGSPVIGFIDNGNQLGTDLFGIFKGMTED